jgi:hypothetical protein
MWLTDKISDVVSDLWGPSTPVQKAADMRPMIEQAAARTMLADKLEVVPDEQAGLRLPNQVSPEEFERMSHMYADIMGDRSDLHIGRTMDDGSQRAPATRLDEKEYQKFRSGALGDIATMMQTESGRELLERLAYTGDKHHVTTIDPASDKRRPHEAGDKQTSEVYYAPGESWEKEGLDLRSDVNLYHELAHAYHDVLDDQAHGAVHPVHRYDENHHVQRFEYQAVGLDGEGDPILNENNYRSERRDLGETVSPRDRYAPEDSLY